MPSPHESESASVTHAGAYRGENLVFIISQPRAGSTLLQRMLAGHPDIQTSAETWLMLHPVYGLRRKGITTDYRAQWAATGVREFLDHYADGKETYYEGIRRFAQSVYGDVLARNGKKIFLDKTPRYTMIVPELRELFPAARFVLLIRNPLSVLMSELNTYIRDDWWKLANFNPDLLDAPGRLINARALLGEQAIEVRYETLVTEPGQELQRICNHLSLTYDASMLDYSDTPAPSGRMNDPVGIHRHTSPSATSLQKWTALGENAQHRHFALSYLEALGASVIRELGYDPEALRSTIEEMPLRAIPAKIYPWQLATTPRQRLSMRQKMMAAYYATGQKKGTLAGIVAAGSVLLGRANSIVERSSGDARARANVAGQSDAAENVK